jgi:RNA polymerase sigma factor (sigma-70 family)
LAESDKLFDRFSRSDPDAAAEVSAIISRVVRLHGYRIPSEQWQDVRQNAILGVWGEVAKPGFVLRGGFAGLIREVALRRCIDWRRSHRRDPGPLDVDPAGTSRPDMDLLETERVAIRDKVMSRLRESHREVIRLRAIEDRGYAEIARLQGKSEDSVRRMWCDALKEAGRIRLQLERPRLRPAEAPK